MSKLIDLKCIKCEKVLERVNQERDNFQSYDAVQFSGAGSYGSKWDYGPPIFIMVCDDCINEGASKGTAYVTKTIKKAVDEIFSIDYLLED